MPPHAAGVKGWAHTGPPFQVGTPTPHFAPVAEMESPATLGERLRAAIADAGVSQRELARRVAGPGADERRVENERRQIGKYLAGQHAPAPARARLLEEILGKPEGYLLGPNGKPRRVADQVGEVYDLLAEVSEMIEERAGESVKEPPWAARIRRSLGELAGAVDEMAHATADSLAHLQAEIARLSEQRQPEAQPDHRKAGP